MDKVLYKNILATITYYDVLDYPLTAFEIWKCLIRCTTDHSNQSWSLQEVYGAMLSPEINQYIQERNGLYILYGREHLFALRRKREFISYKKMARLQRIIFFLRCSPFVRMICVTGRLSYNNCDRKSDLDLLVVYENGHIWTGRFFLTIITHILGVRRYDKHINDRICLNYHITTDSLCVPTKDLFAAHEYSFIIPIYDSGIYEKFVAENAWICSYKPHYIMQGRKYVASMSDHVIAKFFRVTGEWILGDKGMECRLRRLQSDKIKSNPKTNSPGGIIVYNNQYLIFLPRPHGPRIFEEYKRRYNALEINF